ncbi:MAG: helix-turn-helix transcriptional regulator [Thermomicrobiales bacterium]
MTGKPLKTLRQHRQLAGMTIRDLASAAGVGTQTIVRIERGEPARIESYRKIAAALDIEITDIREYVDMVMHE